MKGPFSLLLGTVLSSKDGMLCCQRCVFKTPAEAPVLTVMGKQQNSFDHFGPEQRDSSWRSVWDTLHLDFYPDDPCEPLWSYRQGSDGGRLAF